ncbi:MAG: LacI family DNA-binding transcriptional regulator [Anaerolinea sp.]|nr:LacI family DNA-binding transcriptional regulator [Anaerolinea sp.]
MTSTIFDVAKHAGVSIGTVSRVLNNRDRVSQATRERVLRAIRELDYHPNSFAQGLASQQTDTIGLVLPQVNDPFFYEIVRGVEDVVTAAGYSLMIVSQPRQTSESHYGRMFRRGIVDAMILASVDVYPDEIREIIAGGVPVTFIQQNPGKDVPAVMIDNYGGMAELTTHLIGHGYKRFAYITGTNHTPDNAERLRAVRETLEGHGLHLPKERIVEGNYLRGSGYRAMFNLLDLAERPDVVIAGNDQMAVDAILAAQERGLTVPDDIAVTGFDDVPLASYVNPPLTTVHQPIFEVGGQAARLALDLVRAAAGGKTPISPRVILPTTLVIRRSCGCEQ